MPSKRLLWWSVIGVALYHIGSNHCYHQLLKNLYNWCKPIGSTLMPRSPMFSKLFGRSPVTPLQAHMNKAAECTLALRKYFETLRSGEWDRVSECYDTISQIEDEADALKKEIRLNLPSSLFLPVSRSDLLERVRVQDEIPNRAKDIAGIVLGRKMQVPESLTERFMEFVQISIDATEKTRSMLESLDELLDSGFSTREIDRIETMIAELGELETDSDRKQIQIRSALYELEKDLNAVDVMFLYKVIDWIGDIADHAQTVGNRMLYVIAR